MSTNPTGPVIGPVLQAWYRWKALRLPWRKRFLVGLDLRGNTYWEFRLARGDPTSHPGNASSAGKQQPYPFRRIIHYPRKTHLDEVSVPPAWHQWLRYQRQDPPTLDEQRADVVRQARMKRLAAEADARWAAKPSYLEHPTTTPTSTFTKDNASAAQTQPSARTRIATPIAPPGSGEKKSRGGDSPAENAEAEAEAEAEAGANATQRTRGGQDETVDMATRRTRIESEVKAKPRKEEDPWKAADDARRGGPSETWQPQAWDPSKSASSTRRR